MVVVNIPIAGVDMDFNCAKTMDSVDDDFGVEEVGTILIIPFPLIYDL